jgi:enoyl-CoA hydratase/carnithine racemase
MALVNVEVAEGVATLELNRPEVRNALSRALLEELSEALLSLESRDEVRALVLFGSGGKAFASGADIAELRERTHREGLLAFAARTFQQLEDFPRPTVAALEGYALGGGLELALACDLRVGARTAKVGLPEVTLGILPGAGGTWRLQRLVGLGRARELIFTGRILDADEAYALGLLERCVEAGTALAEAQGLARQIAQNAPLAVQLAKVALNAAARGGEGAALERLGQGLLLDSEDKRERMTAFLEKRSRK